MVKTHAKKQLGLVGVQKGLLIIAAALFLCGSSSSCQFINGDRYLIPHFIQFWQIMRQNGVNDVDWCSKNRLFTARCTFVQSAVLRLHVVRPSVRTSVDQDHIG